MGVFIDSPVQGLTYQSGTVATGTTDATGMFDYTVGETLSFSVGAVQLGTLPDGKPLITPNDFAAAAENIARFLQTLDADGEHINGIDLTAAATALANTALDASAFISDATTFETTIRPILETALGAGAVLVSAQTALANLAAALDTTFEVAELAGSFLSPANGVAMDLTGVDGRSFDSSGSLLTIKDSVDQISLTMLLNGSLAAGGDTMTFVTTNLSGDQSNHVFQLDAMPFGQDPALTAAFAGATVTGSFNYANWVPPAGVVAGPASYEYSPAATYV